MRIILLKIMCTTILFLTGCVLYGQEHTKPLPCSDSEILKRQLQYDPNALLEREKNEVFIKNYLDKLKTLREKPLEKSVAATYTIPVVIHVFHNGSDGRLDFSQIQSGIDILNTDFQGLNSDYDQVEPEFDAIKASLDIEFKLAKLDPNGNPTTGVIYYDDPEGMLNQKELKQYAWDNYKYMNIYLPKYAFGAPSTLTAFATYPSENSSNQGRDGITYSSIRWGYGSHSELENGQEWASIITHEVGHWLNLLHTFENGCDEPGDYVDDTPPTLFSRPELQGCFNNNLSCQVVTNGENYMDYNIDCKKMFTQGQVERMIAALHLPSRVTIWSNSNLTATGVSENQIDYAYIPDANFEQALIDLGIDSDNTINQQVLLTDVAAVTELDVSTKSITDLTGIEEFTNLEKLVCYENAIEHLDLSKNTSLKYLHTAVNNLLALDLSNNPDLETLFCYSNNISNLNLSQNTKLMYLGCSNNNLSNLNLSQQVNLIHFNGNNNQLNGLDLSKNTKLEAVYCRSNQLKSLNIKNGNNSAITKFSAFDNPELSCINVDNETAATNGQGSYADWLKDNGTLFSESCQNEYTYIPDSNFEQALIDLGIDSDGVVNQQVLTYEVSSITELVLNEKGISDLTGIEDFKSLTHFTCIGNQISTFDLSSNKELLWLFMPSNGATELNVSECTKLEILGCYDNQFKQLDLSNNIALRELTCYNNQLISLNLKSGTNETLTYVHMMFNPDLMCIAVDDPVAAENKSGSYKKWYKDESASYSDTCEVVLITEIPDPNFEQALIDLGIDSDLTINGQVFTSDIAGVENLDVGERGISDLTGIEDFASLANLSCDNNQLTSLILNQNSALKWLYAHDNQLTQLDVSQNQLLERLACHRNNLTELNVSQNPLLQNLTCSTNQLTQLDISNNPDLRNLTCSHNNLSALDTSQNPLLEQLWCYTNTIESLNLQHNTQLNSFQCSSNELTYLNVKNGANDLLTEFNAQYNPLLNCIQVDDEIAANTGSGQYSTWEKDAQVTFAEDCVSDTDADGINDYMDLCPNSLNGSVVSENGCPENTTILFSENFNDCNSTRFVSFNEASNKNWICRIQFGQTGTGCYQMNGYNQNVRSKDWLITDTPINFSQNAYEKISFFTKSQYDNTPLELVYSNDYDGSGNPADFSWNPVPNVNIPAHTSGSAIVATIFSEIDVSEIVGQVYFAFKYYSTQNPTRWTVDNFLITADSDPDLDNDGIVNDRDLCDNTDAGVYVDENGCEVFYLSPENFTIEITSETCPDKNNGKITISATEQHDYKVTLNTAEYNFSDDLTIENLDPGPYDLCISVNGEEFEQCYSLTIDQGVTISGKSSLATNVFSVELVKGTPPYSVFVNNQFQYEIMDNSINLKVNHGDLVEIKSKFECEGIFSERIALFDGFVAYPNPSNGSFEVAVPLSYKEILIEVYTPSMQYISSKRYAVQNGKIKLNMENLPSGIYLLRMMLESPITIQILKS